MRIEQLYQLKERGINIPDEEVLKASIPSSSPEFASILESNSETIDRIALLVNTLAENEYIAVKPHSLSIIKCTSLELGNFKLGIVIEKGVITSRVALTVYDEKGLAIAFRDLEVRVDNQNSSGHHGPATAILTNPLFIIQNLNGQISHVTDIPGFDSRIRHLENDTLFVNEEYRGKGIGKKLLFISLILAKLLGSKYHYISHDESENDEGISFYSQFIHRASEDIMEWIFPLESNVYEDVFSIKEP